MTETMCDKDILYRSISSADIDSVKRILSDEPALIEGRHLFCAARAGHYAIVKYLVEYSRISLNELDDQGRDVLHHCALSDNVGLWDYLIRRCGMDPFAGDKDGTTPWELAVQCSSTEITAYMEAKYGHISDYYKNPVRTGMYPDPSIVRVGDDYYMVNSSFIFYPCIPVSHSTDLIHWEIIGHAITNREWTGIDGLDGGRGYWAADISFYEDRFYITATLRYNDDTPHMAADGTGQYRRQIVVSSDRPEGPYTEPAYIEEDGIDPSIFNDDDGRRYMLLNRGARILELDKSGTRQISEAKLLMYGDMKRAPEGPHLYKKDGYYYLLLAEGGTGTGHRVTAFRSKSLMGDYEACPYNPIMRQTDMQAAIQRCGHGDLVETSDGRWFMVYLCGRMLEGKYSILGRETALDPVTWTADGWPVVNGLKGPSVLNKKPHPEIFATTSYKKQTLSECGLPLEFMTPRTFAAGDIECDPAEDGGHNIGLKPSAYPLSDVRCRSVVLRRQTDFAFTAEVSVMIPEDMSEGEEIGITGYYDENTYCTYGIICMDGSVRLCVKEHIGDTDTAYLLDRIEQGETDIRISMRTDCLERDLYLRDKLIYTLQNVYYLCDEGLERGKRFTGAMIGVYAVRSRDVSDTICRRFEEFVYTAGI